MDKKKFTIGFISGAAVALAASVYLLLLAGSHTGASTETSPELSALHLKGLDGQTVSLHTGKPTVINVWTTWCAPCLKEFPDFEKEKKKYDGKVTILMASDETPQVVSRFANRRKFDLNLVTSLRTLDNGGLKIRPVTYFYNSKGEFVSKIVGETTAAQLETEIKKLD